MKYAVVDNKIKFFTHEKDGEYYFSEIEGSIAIGQPTAEILHMCEGKSFNTFDDAKVFIEGDCPKTELEILRETVDVLLLNSLEV